MEKRELDDIESELMARATRASDDVWLRGRVRLLVPRLVTEIRRLTGWLRHLAGRGIVGASNALRGDAPPED